MPRPAGSAPHGHGADQLWHRAVAAHRALLETAVRATDLLYRTTVNPGVTFDGPVLLIDDFADSRWTFTVASRALRLSGAPAVLPFALALRA